MSQDPENASSDSSMESDSRSDSDVDSHSDTEVDPSSSSVVDSNVAEELNIVPDHGNNLDSDNDSDLYSDSDEDSDSFVGIEYFESDVIGELLVGGSDSWESLGNLAFHPLTIYSPCHMDNTTHWLCGDEDVSSLILFFNFESNQFGEIIGPAHMDKSYVREEVSLVVLDNCLSIFDSFTTKTMVYVWKMKEYGAKDSWVRAFVIDKSSWGTYICNSFLPVICRSNGEVVMVSSSGYILFYDLLKKTGRIVDHPPLSSPINIAVHTPSLMSLTDVVRGSNLEVMNVASRFVHTELDPLNYLLLEATFSE